MSAPFATDAPDASRTGEKYGERTDDRAKFPESNPFSTRFTAPGKIPFFFERSFLRQLKASKPAKFEEFFIRALGAGEDIRGSVCLQFLVDRFETNGRRGQLVGPHGSGKSTLTCALKEALTKRGYEIFSWSLNDRNRFLPDVFWLELQRFLQSAPAFLPVKCLLPPPVVSAEDYWEQAREVVRDLSDVETFDDDQEEKFDDVATIDEFCVGEQAAENSAKSDGTECKTSPNANATASTTERRDGFFGFNAAGNFGFNATRRGDAAPRWPAPPQKANAEGTDAPTPFAPFPGVAPPNESTACDAANETAPNAEFLAESIEREVRNAASDARESQKKLEIPLPTLDFQKKRGAMFDKKVVFFDGFEQLSYANRVVVRTFCRMNRLGLLLTTHSPAIGIPVLFRATPSVEILRQILNYLLDDLDMTPEDAELEILLKNFNYDVREILFSLYDAFESYRWAPREMREKIVRRYPR
ncbi:MAG: hypothetical protein IKK39_10500 [Thermoguttaceae bacterium]|nr:hypothetical protein [Thermoguttaceae bacterium]